MLIIILGLIFGGLFIWLSDVKTLTQKGKQMLRILAVITIMSSIMLGAFYPWPIGI